MWFLTKRQSSVVNQIETIKKSNGTVVIKTGIKISVQSNRNYKKEQRNCGSQNREDQMMTIK